MKKVEIQITQTFEEHPTDVLKFLLGKTLDCIYTLNMPTDSDLLRNSTAVDAVHEKLYFKTTDGLKYEMMSEEYTEDYYIDMKKSTIKSVEQVESEFKEFQLPIKFFIHKIFIFSLVQPISAEKWHIESIYSEKWHSKKRQIKFKEEFYPDVYTGQVSEDSHLVFVNDKDEYLAIGTQLAPYFTITTNQPYINDFFTGESWIKEGVPSPYKLSRTID